MIESGHSHGAQPVQFQKGISLNAFLSLYGNEDQCCDALFQWRWPNGFLCPHCAHDRCCQLNTRKLQQYNRCHHQTFITAGTIFETTKLPLTVWFQGLYFMTQDKKGASTMPASAASADGGTGQDPVRRCGRDQ